MLDLVPDVVAPLRALYQWADEQFDDLSRLFRAGEIETVVRSSKQSVTSMCPGGVT